MHTKRALLVVDIQNDFCPGGALGIAHGDSILPAVNALISLFDTIGEAIVFSRDWHPIAHMSFIDNGGPWPVHCVQGTVGAAFHPSVQMPQCAFFIHKSTDVDHEAYSAFDRTGLEGLLRGQDVEEIVVCGLATDYCVRATALDAIKAGFRVIIVTDGICGVNVHQGDSERALAEIVRAGATPVISADFLEGHL